MKKSIACIKNETRVLSVFKLWICGKVPFSLTLKSWFWHECSPWIFNLTSLTDYIFIHVGASQPAILQKELSQIRFPVFFPIAHSENHVWIDPFTWSHFYNNVLSTTVTKCEINVSNWKDFTINLLKVSYKKT